ncbi:hypothetical protein PHYSODRAFT_341819 [Phytophthora sojae]|uniref:Uncharacterized protein n=1 Tax=Phytophthora sojae (strain P6497) TaxID=1094619 RepID=G5AEG9_PHYSP|nr:hypothetical protein PHYSODRAFT_341819 [Phytophthora sojae]EGZ06571.1 hypothetical protein PHYSODRAFT_341819 [Phytophthora sojae]|eukprot:XP_009538468.1 hypothetical protein PHYSODRAFT_341819 [Phytophthora sojae]
MGLIFQVLYLRASDPIQTYLWGALAGDFAGVVSADDVAGALAGDFAGAFVSDFAGDADDWDGDLAGTVVVGFVGDLDGGFGEVSRLGLEVEVPIGVPASRTPPRSPLPLPWVSALRPYVTLVKQVKRSASVITRAPGCSTLNIRLTPAKMATTHLRASPTLPFTSKTPAVQVTSPHGADPSLGVKMACVGAYMHEAYLKVLLVLVVKMPNESRVPISLGHQKIKREFIQLSYAIYVMQGTSEPLAALGIETATLSNLSVLKSDLPSVLDYVSKKHTSGYEIDVSLVNNTKCTLMFVLVTE